MKFQSKRFTFLTLLLTVALALTACVAVAPATGDDAMMEKEGGYVVGVSNTLVGNGWREQMICAIKAEA
ncbi:MAG: hypothetical protein OXF86_00005, partial [Caldilineaceae bacterium]|nr:hypothetical protein [Caldilineaceae bacterium]